MKPAMLIDITKCAGCKACVVACKEINELPRDGQTETLSATTWSAIESRGGIFVRRQCMHCLDPACVAVCPVAALQKTPEGAVVYDASRCMGCRYCMIGCPFGVPRYEWGSVLPKVQKCIFCYEKRLTRGEMPACAAACPTNAILFGDRDDLIREAQQRIENDPDRYVDHVYGLHEAGGTSILYLSNVSFESLGFRTNLQKSPYPRLTWDVLSKLPNVVSVAGVLLGGIWWISVRRDTLEKVKRGELTMREAMKESPPLTGPVKKDDR